MFETMVRSAQIRAFVVGLAGVLASSCAPVNDSRGQPVRDVPPHSSGFPPAGTGPESKDVLAIADRMMRSLLSAPVVAEAERPPTVVLLEFRNYSRFPVDSQLFLRKLRSQLNSRASGRLVFLGRERMNDIIEEGRRKRSGEVMSAPDHGRTAPGGAEYFLTGELRGLAKASAAGRSDYLVYIFTMIDAKTSAVVWEDEFETKRFGQDDPVYR